MTLKEGQGIMYLSFPLWILVNDLICSYNGTPFYAAPARAKASETAKIAFAPSLFLHHPN